VDVSKQKIDSNPHNSKIKRNRRASGDDLLALSP
jgi:hypothetical protein